MRSSALPETRRSSAVPLLSRVWCRCVGTFRPVRPSRGEAAARCRRSTAAPSDAGTADAAVSPAAVTGGPRAPALLRITHTNTHAHTNTAEEDEEEEEEEEESSDLSRPASAADLCCEDEALAHSDRGPSPC